MFPFRSGSAYDSLSALLRWLWIDKPQMQFRFQGLVFGPIPILIFIISPEPKAHQVSFNYRAWPIKVKFYVKPPWVGGTKVCSQHLGHMTNMAITPIYDKPFQNFLLRNRWTDFYETWYVPSGTRAHHSLFK